MASSRFDPNTPVQYLKGVGPNRARILEKAGIRTAEELLFYRPFRYEDRTNFQRIAELRNEVEAVIEGSVLAAGGYASRRKGMKIFELLLSDGTAQVPVKFFNQPYLSNVFREGSRVVFFGTPRFDPYSRGLSLLNPEFEILEPGTDATLHSGRIVPIYRRIGSLTTRQLRKIVHTVLEKGIADWQDPLPQAVRSRYRFPERAEALGLVHFPEKPEGVEAASWLAELNRFETPAHQRFIFEEFFLFQLGLELIKKRRELSPKPRHIATNDRIREALKAILPFKPTNAQKRVLGEILQDLCSPKVMHRLLQGDVGSGKTIVALMAMVVVIENGYQTALMAPTEILADQHFRNISRLLQKADCGVAFLSSSVKGAQRKEILRSIESGETKLVVGTHSLIQDPVAFRELGLIVIDEQHRFGVLQRSQLMEKGNRPDTLVMTATPIPRSLALTLYGDLEVSVIDELPPGRRPIKTVVKTEESRNEVYNVLERELHQGRQVFIVYPLVEESEKVDLKAATEMAEHLQRDVFPSCTVGLLHGRMTSDQKDELMTRFKAGDVQILVATTVVEVGIDVPNASVMVVEHAERFGLSQLHQLRGRIGRGGHPGLCILMIERVRSKEAYDRLDIMRKSNDGFRIAEKDLEIRGPGEFIGTRQSGVPEFRFGNIVRDRKLLELAHIEAGSHLQQVVKEAGESAPRVLGAIVEAWKQRFGLSEVG